MTTITRQELAALLVQTGGAHHQAYIESDGVDPSIGWRMMVRIFSGAARRGSVR